MRYHHFAHVYQKSQSYDVWFLRYGMRQTEVFIMDRFLLFYLPMDPENENFEKIKKKKKKKKKKRKLEDIIIYKCLP